MLVVCAVILMCKPSHLPTLFIHHQSTSVGRLRWHNPHPHICHCTCYLWHSLPHFCHIFGSTSNTFLFSSHSCSLKTVKIYSCIHIYIDFHTIYLYIPSSSSFIYHIALDIRLVRNVNFNCAVRSRAFSANRDKKNKKDDSSAKLSYTFNLKEKNKSVEAWSQWAKSLREFISPWGKTASSCE